MLDTPVAMLIFNRPGPTSRVFERVRQARPRKLLVVADGPRPHRAGEAERCVQTRRIFDSIDWPCERITEYAPENLGCRMRVSSGLTWVFEQVEEAIILEDDCLPEPTFFPYCRELLERYRHDERIMSISGDDFLPPRRTPDSYHFSRYMNIWGWASWRRAWRHYDLQMRLWPAVRDGHWLDDLLDEPRALAFWTRVFQQVHDGRIDTWDYQWQFAIWTQSGFVAMSNTNLVTNIGFGAGATHTTRKGPMADLPTAPMEFPIRHPAFVMRDAEADAYTHRTFHSPGLWPRIKMRLRRTVSRTTGNADHS